MSTRCTFFNSLWAQKLSLVSATEVNQVLVLDGFLLSTFWTTAEVSSAFLDTQLSISTTTSQVVMTDQDKQRVPRLDEKSDYSLSLWHLLFMAAINAKGLRDVFPGGTESG